MVSNWQLNILGWRVMHRRKANGAPMLRQFRNPVYGHRWETSLHRKVSLALLECGACLWLPREYPQMPAGMPGCLGGASGALMIEMDCHTNLLTVRLTSINALILVSPNQALPQKYASLPASPLDQNTGHKDTRTSTDPGTHDRFLLFPPATLAEQACLPKLPPSSTPDPAPDFSSQRSSQLTHHRPISLGTGSQENAPPLSDHLSQPSWDKDLVKPGAVLFSTGPVMSKAPTGPPPSTDPARRSSGDRTFWAAPSGVPSTNPSSDSTPTQDRETVPPPGYQPDTPSLVYTTGHSANTSSHPGYPHPYPTYPGNAPFGPSSPRHPSFGGPPNSSPHVQGGGYPNTGSATAFPNYRPGMPYSPYTPYQSGSGFSQYPTSPPTFGPMPGNFPGGYSTASPVAGGYPTSPSSGNYQGSSVGGGYSSPTGAYGMHFAPYGMVSGPSY
ncbi:hypothetical protein AG1IA_01949 [Rhizoctonia solani AG-1 IA]|uniref:Uncharacterized protein n=1 Tax=Thanatephorus cucumeris (strain AG1-IA) TaxID=983506 RepID=L8X4R8_THACA|nr:hypothetical protein AG1IA_01949 [Rhizoctonia solani AG-1 IA]